MLDDDIGPGLARLIAAHPRLFKGHAPAVASYVSPGWQELVEKLCCDIEAVLGPNELREIEIRQIKEKFGTLRFYWRHGTMDLPRVDLLSAEGFASFESSPPEADRRFELVRELVNAACDASATICETCGRPGRLVVQRGWRMTRCIEHASPVDESAGS